MKTDARIRYTVHIIQRVFLELLKEKPIAKITVKEICERAEINRSTFYKHYQDVYDLMKKLENEAIEEFEKLLDSYAQNEIIPALVTLLNSLQEHREFLAPLIANSSKDDFIKRLTAACSEYALSHLTPEKDYTSNPKQAAVYAYLAGGTAGIITNWLENDASESSQQVAELIQALNETVLTAPVP
ncbi:MAG: TetR/AcrR family transcriptional regulator [Mediterraneibacter gnavus]